MTWRLTLLLVALPWMRRWPRRFSVAAAVALWAVVPAVLMAALGGLVARGRRVAGRRREERRAGDEVALLGDLVVLGLTGGLGLAQALAVAGTELESGLATEVDDVVRRMHRDGAAALLDAGAGRAGRLYLMAGRAMATGAPLLAAVESFVDDTHGEEARRRKAAARRLPVLMMFPLALLILPGFMLLLVAPALVSAVGRLGL